MTVSAHLYTNAIAKAFNKEIDLDTDTIKVMLCTSTYVPNQATHVYKSSVTNEVTGTGYTAGGAALSSVTVTASGTTYTFSAANTSWPSSTLVARYAVIYDSTGTDATSALIGYVDFGADVSTTNGTFAISWNASGIVAVTVS